jgi:L-lactate dehydrogenase complex protein LldG
MNRDTFLSNIRQSLQTAYLPAAHSHRPPSPALSNFEPEQLVPQFIQEVVALKGKVHQVESMQTAIQCIDDIFTAHQATEFLAWADKALPIKNLRVRLAELGYTQRDSTISTEARCDDLSKLAEVSIGLTGVMAGLADTGSLVLPSSSGQGRLASLLPLVHIALLKINLLFPSMAHFIQAHPDAARQSSNLVFITGPSRTGDIEQVLTLGVHGPRELYVVLMP